MKVKVVQKSGYGTRDNVMHDCGSVIELPDDVARKLATYGIVALLPEEKKAAPVVETAAPAPAETTAARTGKPRGRPRKTVS